MQKNCEAIARLFPLAHRTGGVIRHLHTGQFLDHGFDFVAIPIRAVENDQVFLAAGEGEPPVLHAGQVARDKPAVGCKGFCIQVGAVVIAGGDGQPAHLQAAHFTSGHDPLLLVHNPQRHARNRPADLDKRIRIAGRGEGKVVGMDDARGGFRHTIAGANRAIPRAAGREECQKPARGFGDDGFSPVAHPLQTGQVPLPLGHVLRAIAN